MNPATDYPKRPVRYQIRETDTVTPDDYCMNSRPENRRGFENTHLYNIGCDCRTD